MALTDCMGVKRIRKESIAVRLIKGGNNEKCSSVNNRCT